jgi:hypothetical protein
MNKVTPIGVKTATALKLTSPAYTDLEDYALLRLERIIGNPKKGIPPILPIGKSTFLLRVKQGIYPAPVRLSKMTVAWKKSDIIALLDSFGGV